MKEYIDKQELEEIRTGIYRECMNKEYWSGEDKVLVTRILCRLSDETEKLPLITEAEIRAKAIDEFMKEVAGYCNRYALIALGENIKPDKTRRLKTFLNEQRNNAKVRAYETIKDEVKRIAEQMKEVE